MSNLPGDESGSKCPGGDAHGGGVSTRHRDPGVEKASSQKHRSHSHESDIVGSLFARRPLFLSLSGCGFLAAYHVGVLACLREHGQHVISNLQRVYGSSAGALIGLCYLAGFPSEKIAELALALSLLVSSSPLGIIDPGIHLPNVIRAYLEDNLPDDIHLTCSDKLFINLTSFPSYRPFLVSQYLSKADLIDALVCTSFLPLVFGLLPPKFRGQRYMDGGLTNNLPQHRVVYKRLHSVNEEMLLRSSYQYEHTKHGVQQLGEKVYTITVSPFSGEGDICPRDNHTQTATRIELWNMSIGLTMDNFYRLLLGFVNPSQQGIVERFIGGYNDAERFLVTHKLSRSTDLILCKSTNCTTITKVYARSGCLISSHPAVDVVLFNRCARRRPLHSTAIPPPSPPPLPFHQELSRVLSMGGEELLRKYSRYLPNRHNSNRVQAAALRLGLKASIGALRASSLVLRRSVIIVAPCAHTLLTYAIPLVSLMPLSQRLVDFLRALQLATLELNK